MRDDTSPEQWQRYVAGLQAIPAGIRARQLDVLTTRVRALAMAGLRRRHPEASEEELRIRFAAQTYGRKAAALLGPVPPDAAEPR